MVAALELVITVNTAAAISPKKGFRPKERRICRIPSYSQLVP